VVFLLALGLSVAAARAARQGERMVGGVSVFVGLAAVLSPLADAATGAHQAGWAVSKCSPPSRELGICGDR
jgi:hypothetical protein